MNLNRTQTRALISGGTAAFGVTAAVRDIRKARHDKDKLMLLDAVLSIAAVLTGLAIAIRAFRNDGSA